MRKLLLILPIVLLGCAELSEEHTPLMPFIPPETIHNDKCVEIQKYKVFQVFDKGALATACEPKIGSTDFCFGMTVFVPAQKGEDFYDDRIIVPTDGKCIIFDGVYKYTSKGAGDKTVPKLKVVEARIPNPAYLEWIEFQETNIP